MKSLFVWFPDELHEKFRIKLIKEGKTIKEVILSFASLYVGEEDNAKKQKQEPKTDRKKNEK